MELGSGYQGTESVCVRFTRTLVCCQKRPTDSTLFFLAFNCAFLSWIAGAGGTDNEQSVLPKEHRRRCQGEVRGDHEAQELQVHLEAPPDHLRADCAHEANSVRFLHEEREVVSDDLLETVPAHLAQAIAVGLTTGVVSEPEKARRASLSDIAEGAQNTLPDT